MAVGWPEECLPGSASGERRGWGNITKLPSQFLKLGQWGPMWLTDQVSSQKAWQRQQSERVFKHPGLQRPMGNAQKFLTSPPPISALQQCRKSSYYLQSTEENRFLKNTPTPPTVLRRQRLCSPDLPQIHHSPISFLQSGMESSNLTSSRQGPRHPPHSAFTAILESAWQRPRCSSSPPFLHSSGDKEASTQDSQFNSLKLNPMRQLILCFQPLTVIYFYLK